MFFVSVCTCFGAGGAFGIRPGARPGEAQEVGGWMRGRQPRSACRETATRGQMPHLLLGSHFFWFLSIWCTSTCGTYDMRVLTVSAFILEIVRVEARPGSSTMRFIEDITDSIPGRVWTLLSMRGTREASRGREWAFYYW